MRWTPWLSAALLPAIGCGPSLEYSPYANNTLPPPSVQIDEEMSSNRRDFTGQISVDDSASGFDLSLTTNVGRVEITARSSANSDVSILDAVEGRISVAEDAVSDELSLLVVDDDGPLLLLETTTPTVLSSDAFGVNFVTTANDLGSVPVGATELFLTSAYVGTDDGEVEAFPGEPLEILVGGLSYRFVLIASWTRYQDEEIGLQCSIDEILAYEVARVEPGTASTAPLERPSTQEIDNNACSPAPPVL